MLAGSTPEPPESVTVAEIWGFALFKKLPADGRRFVTAGGIVSTMKVTGTESTKCPALTLPWNARATRLAPAPVLANEERSTDGNKCVPLLISGGLSKA